MLPVNGVDGWLWDGRMGKECRLAFCSMGVGRLSMGKMCRDEIHVFSLYSLYSSMYMAGKN